MNIHVYLHHSHSLDPSESTKLDDIRSLLANLLNVEKSMANALDDLTNEVTNATTVQQSAILLLQGLKKKLDEAGTDPVKLKTLRDSLNASDQQLADAITANTPAA